MYVKRSITPEQGYNTKRRIYILKQITPYAKRKINSNYSFTFMNNSEDQHNINQSLQHQDQLKKTAIQFSNLAINYSLQSALKEFQDPLFLNTIREDETYDYQEMSSKLDNIKSEIGFEYQHIRGEPYIYKKHKHKRPQSTVNTLNLLRDNSLSSDKFNKSAMGIQDSSIKPLVLALQKSFYLKEGNDLNKSFIKERPKNKPFIELHSSKTKESNNQEGLPRVYIKPSYMRSSNSKKDLNFQFHPEEESHPFLLSHEIQNSKRRTPEVYNMERSFSHNNGNQTSKRRTPEIPNVDKSLIVNKLVNNFKTISEEESQINVYPKRIENNDISISPTRKNNPNSSANLLKLIESNALKNMNIALTSNVINNVNMNINYNINSNIQVQHVNYNTNVINTSFILPNNNYNTINSHSKMTDNTNTNGDSNTNNVQSYPVKTPNYHQQKVSILSNMDLNARSEVSPIGITRNADAVLSKLILRSQSPNNPSEVSKERLQSKVVNPMSVALLDLNSITNFRITEESLTSPNNTYLVNNKFHSKFRKSELQKIKQNGNNASIIPKIVSATEKKKLHSTQNYFNDDDFKNKIAQINSNSYGINEIILENYKGIHMNNSNKILNGNLQKTMKNAQSLRKGKFNRSYFGDQKPLAAKIKLSDLVANETFNSEQGWEADRDVEESVILEEEYPLVTEGTIVKVNKTKKKKSIYERKIPKILENPLD